MNIYEDKWICGACVCIGVRTILDCYRIYNPVK